MSDAVLPSGMTTTDDSAIATAPGPQDYATTVADLAVDADIIIALWSTGLSHNGRPDVKLDWYYRNNLEGAPLIVLLHHSGTRGAVGVAAVGPRRIRFGNETLTGGVMVDFVIQPDHRTFFPAMFLQRETRRRALGQFAILFGLPNAKAQPIMHRVGHRCVGQLVRRVRVLQSSAYLVKYLPDKLSRIIGGAIDRCRSTSLAIRGLFNNGYISQWLERPDDAFNELWRRAATPNVVIGFRDMAFLTWRFANVPSKPFKFFTLASSTDQQLVAYAVCAAHGSVLHVHDFLVDPQISSASTRLWLNLTREAIRLGYSSLSIEFLGSDRQQRQLGDAGLLVRGRQPVYASVTESPNGADVWPTEMSPWYMTAADCD